MNEGTGQGKTCPAFKVEVFLVFALMVVAAILTFWATAKLYLSD